MKGTADENRRDPDKKKREESMKEDPELSEGESGSSFGAAFDPGITGRGKSISFHQLPLGWCEGIINYYLRFTSEWLDCLGTAKSPVRVDHETNLNNSDQNTSMFDTMNRPSSRTC